MPGVVIVGAGIAGLATALMLGREGRKVVVCERDPAPVPASTEEMWSAWHRPSTPQARLGHTFLPGFRVLLEQRAPDVVERVWAAGAPAVDFSAELPGGARLPEDAELQGIMCRRGVFEGILRQAVEAEATVEVRAGCQVTALLAEKSSRASVPTVVGVKTVAGGSIPADAVVVAGGRLLPIARWLEAIGAEKPEVVSEGCGSVTFTRYFRIRMRADEDHRVSAQLTVEGDLGYMRYEIYGADQATFCVELEPPTGDHELRCLRHEDAHMAAARALPEADDWLDSNRSSPIGPVAALGQEQNALRHFVTEKGPLAHGLHVIGDARCQTNSLYAWGCASALTQAAALSDSILEHPNDPMTQVSAFEAAVSTEVADRHALSLARDRAYARKSRGESEWDPFADELEFIEGVMVPAADHDPEVFRAVNRREFQLEPVRAIARDKQLLDRARVVAGADHPRPAPPSAPTRQALLEMVTGLP